MEVVIVVQSKRSLGLGGASAGGYAMVETRTRQLDNGP